MPASQTTSLQMYVWEHLTRPASQTASLQIRVGMFGLWNGKSVRDFVRDFVFVNCT